LPMPLDHATGQAVAGDFFVIGGRSNGIVAVSSAVFLLEADGWTTRAPMPTARGGIASGVVGARIIVVGGLGVSLADRWESLDDMPTPRHGMAAAGLDGSLYVPGGANKQAFGAVATHEVLHL
jgi:N-acetylneuraminic acid mutarotase